MLIWKWGQGREIPVMFINNEDLSHDKKLTAEKLIRYYHLKSYYGVPPGILNTSNLQSYQDYEEEMEKYAKQPKIAYNHILN
jgi:hypothetical protein